MATLTKGETAMDDLFDIDIWLRRWFLGNHAKVSDSDWEMSDTVYVELYVDNPSLAADYIRLFHLV